MLKFETLGTSSGRRNTNSFIFPPPNWRGCEEALLGIGASTKVEWWRTIAKAWKALQATSSSARVEPPNGTLLRKYIKGNLGEPNILNYRAAPLKANESDEAEQGWYHLEGGWRVQVLGRRRDHHLRDDVRNSDGVRNIRGWASRLRDGIYLSVAIGALQGVESPSSIIVPVSEYLVEEVGIIEWKEIDKQCVKERELLKHSDIFSEIRGDSSSRVEGAPDNLCFDLTAVAKKFQLHTPNLWHRYAYVLAEDVYIGEGHSSIKHREIRLTSSILIDLYSQVS